MKRIVVLDYGSGNVRSVFRMLERVGADVVLSSDQSAALAADGLYVPGVGNFHACMAGLRTVGAPETISARLAADRPVLAVCVGHQVLFESSTEPTEYQVQPGMALWSGEVRRLNAPTVPHTGWSTVTAAPDSKLFAGVVDAHFYFVHSYAATVAPSSRWHTGTPGVTFSTHGESFVAGVEDGVLSGTQFHPEKSGDAGATLLENWIASL